MSKASNEQKQQTVESSFHVLPLKFETKVTHPTCACVSVTQPHKRKKNPKIKSKLYFVL